MSGHLYEDLGGGRFAPSRLTRTGWNDTDQHGGPPSALLARAVERTDLPAPMRPARISFHLLRGIPIAPLRVSTEVSRPGKRVAVIDGRLTTDDGTLVATAHAQMIRTEPVSVPGDLPWPADRLPGPPESHPPAVMAPAESGWSDDTMQRFHLHAVTVRSIDGGWEVQGPGAAWIHLDVDLVDGEDTSPLCRFVTVADMANGVASTLPYGQYRWVNPDLTVALHRPPGGDWVGLSAGASVGPDGIGVVQGTAFDEDGAFGAVLQTQLVQVW